MRPKIVVFNKKGSPLYEYYPKNHLTNVRVVFSDLNSNGYMESFTLNPENKAPEEGYSELLQENHYYPFGMEMEGVWELSVSSPENKYLYNGKELDKDFGLNWYHYGFRMYDPAIGRFPSSDPLAEDYSFQSPYAYGTNNPISFIDFLGLGPIYGPDGTLIGYEVEEGQGPTQIAQDLNDNYSCELSCNAEWTQIVYDNAREFQNVFDGDGNIEDEYNGDYKSGNIEPGEVLVITNGINQTEAKVAEIGVKMDEQEGKIQSLEYQRQSLYNNEQKRNDLYGTLSEYDDYETGEKGGKNGLGMYQQSRYGNTLGGISSSIKAAKDSIKNLETQLKKITDNE